LKKKCSIFAIGAKKRGRFQEAEYYVKLCETLENQPLIESLRIDIPINIKVGTHPKAPWVLKRYS
jgi:hypothetical protein